jgi:GT2 family glycosyltransferase
MVGASCATVGRGEAVTRIAAIVIGIDGYKKYTLPLIRSIAKHEPDCLITVVDNASKEPYPYHPIVEGNQHYLLTRTERLCYSAAINHGKAYGNDADWYIVLSNDVLCTGPFAHILTGYADDNVVGPLLLETPVPRMGMIPYLEGWCMCFPKRVWAAIGGFDKKYIMSSFEDVDASHEARKAGFGLVEDKEFPFVHLDQRQRFYLPGYAGTDEHNMRYFMAKNGVSA